MLKINISLKVKKVVLITTMILVIVLLKITIKCLKSYGGINQVYQAKRSLLLLVNQIAKSATRMMDIKFLARCQTLNWLMSEDPLITKEEKPLVLELLRFLEKIPLRCKKETDFLWVESKLSRNNSKNAPFKSLAVASKFWSLMITTLTCIRWVWFWRIINSIFNRLKVALGP